MSLYIIEEEEYDSIAGGIQKFILVGVEFFAWMENI